MQPQGQFVPQGAYPMLPGGAIPYAPVPYTGQPHPFPIPFGPMYTGPPPMVPIGPGSPFIGAYGQPPPIPPFSTSPGSHGMMNMAQMHGGGGVMHPVMGQPHAPFPLMGGHAPVGSLPPKGDVTPSKALKISTLDGKDIDLRGPNGAPPAGAPIPAPAPAPAPPAVAQGTSTFRSK